MPSVGQQNSNLPLATLSERSREERLQEFLGTAL